MATTETPPPPSTAPVGAPERSEPESRVPVWLLALIPLGLIVVALFALLSVGGDTLGERVGPPVEEIAVERTVLRPGQIELTVRNTGPDPVTVAQMFVNDTYVDYTATGNAIGRNATETFTLDYPWVEDSPYVVTLVSGTGLTTEHQIPTAVATPVANGGFFRLMALLGLYVGIIPVVLGMLFLPLIRRIREHWIRFFMTVTIGLLGFLAIDAYVEGTRIAETGTGAFGGTELLFVGAGTAYLALVGLDRYLKGRRERAKKAGANAYQLSILIAVGIGMHNLGEGLAIGSAYAIGELALGAFLVFGFALQNTTEGLAVVAPLGKERRPSLARLGLLGAIAGAPAIIGAIIGATAYNPELVALLFGVGIGAILQVIVQITPAIRDRAGRALYPASIAGILAGAAVLYVTSVAVG